MFENAKNIFTCFSMFIYRLRLKMKIQTNFSQRNTINNQSKATHPSNISFQNLMRAAECNRLKLPDTFFYRDYPAQIAAANSMQKNFKKNAMVIIASCSNGEELWSQLSLFKNPKEWKFLGVDIEKKLIELANKMVYSVDNFGVDSFLMNPKNSCSEPENNLFQLFHKVFKYGKKPRFEINNSETYACRRSSKSFKQEFFEVKDEYKSLAEFLVNNVNNIHEIDTGGRKVAGVAFRNAAYHDMENHLNEVISGYVDSAPKDIDRQAIANNLINNIDKTVDKNGVFMLGNHEKDHIFLTDNFTSPSDVRKVGDLPDFQKCLKSYKDYIIKYRQPKLHKEYLEDWERVADIEFYAKSPIQSALERDKRFVPIFNSPVNFETDFFTEKYSMPTVWQKVK